MSDLIDIPRIRELDARAMKHGTDPIAAVAKAGCDRLRLHRHDGEWVVTRWCHTHVPGQSHAVWHRVIGTMPQLAAVTAFLSILLQLEMRRVTVVIAKEP